MSETLVNKTCTPCRGGIPPLAREQAELLHAQAPDWQLAEEAHRIGREVPVSQFPRGAYLPSEIFANQLAFQAIVSKISGD